ncbi:hypothetical protein BRADI_3g00945v3 [Brachypodium distachyon]|uniref:Uncharacterized protein n=1 Tax=Brachypodium distachyon TaxID=15368 RepID=A0A2K2CUI1_BRADI|nr:hypothetical protein BRADI_3g00945v3 [Brachypodium distachyon]
MDLVLVLHLWTQGGFSLLMSPDDFCTWACFLREANQPAIHASPRVPPVQVTSYSGQISIFNRRDFRDLFQIESVIVIRNGDCLTRRSKPIKAKTLNLSRSLSGSLLKEVIGLWFFSLTCHKLVFAKLHAGSLKEATDWISNSIAKVLLVITASSNHLATERRSYFSVK